MQVGSAYARAAVVWFQWKGGNARSSKLMGAVTRTMNRQYRALSFSILVCLALFVLLYGDGSKFILWKEAFMWYDPGNLFAYRFFNVTYLRIVEATVGLVTAFVMR